MESDDDNPPTHATIRVIAPYAGGRGVRKSKNTEVFRMTMQSDSGRHTTVELRLWCQHFLYSDDLKTL